MKSKTAFLHGPKDLRVKEVEVPKLKPDQVLVKLGACGICGSDIECFEGLSARVATTWDPTLQVTNMAAKS